MNEKYKFRIVKYSSEATKAKIDKSIVVQAYSTDFDAFDSYFFLDITENKISIKNISTESGNIVKVFGDHITLDTPETPNEETAFLRGYFHLKTKDNVKSAIATPVDKLNHKSSQYKIFSTKWENFQEQFKVWFEEKIIPCLLKETELNKMYFN